MIALSELDSDSIMAKGGRAMDDPRFSKVFSDPRFRAVKRKDLKVALDDRFNKKDLKKEFTLLKSTAKVDKYGRKIGKDDGSSVMDNLDKYYKEETEDAEEEENEGEDDEDDDEDKEEEEDDEEVDAEGSDKENDEDSSSGSEKEEYEDPLAKARGLVDAEDTSDSESDSSDEDVSELEESVASDVEVTEQIPEQEPTTRIAAVNLDWDHLNSTDLFATFSSFLPQDGHIKSVTIYKSEYGKQRIADEELNGPPREIFKQSLDNNDNDEDQDDDDEDDDDEDLDLAKASKKLIQENNGEDEGFDSSELRKYQLQRLRYYYAIVEFNNLESAKEIYKKCDSTEYESSGNFFDLRYVPLDMEFDEADIRDTCTKLPSNYQPIEFSTDSLRNSKPKLTWDETPIERVQILSKSFKQGELDELDLKNYLASDSDEEEQDENISKYKQLVGGPGLGKFDTATREDEGDSDVDMEFTFTPGKASSDLAKGVKDGEEEEKSTIEKLREKEKERRRARKQKVKELKREAQAKKSKGKNAKRNTDEEAVGDLEIEQIGSEGKELHHFNIKDVEKLEKLKSKKNKFKNKRQRELEKELETRLEGSNQDNLEVDDRFAEMLDSHAFVGGSKLLQQERKKRKKMTKKAAKK